MQISKKAIITGAVALGLLGATATTQAEEYKGTAYVAGMGGHFAVAEFTVDPDETRPFVIDSLEKLDIGTGTTHPTHDARIDDKDRNIMYWSTYKLDKEDPKKRTHVGKTDLSTGDIIQDVMLDVPAPVINTAKNYCASGQTSDYYMPITMTKPGYISVIRKSDMKLMHQVFLEGTEADIKKPYKYMHGITSPDMTEYFVTLNESDSPVNNKAYGNTIGKMHMLVLDAKALEQGKVKLLRKGVADGNFKKTISFRQYYSPDGKYIANATGDILFIVDAKTLKVIDAETVGPLEQLHDAIFTPDGKFIVTTSRSKSIFPDCADPVKPKPDEYLMDGHFKLYSMEDGEFIGKTASVCLDCHDQELGTGEDAVHAVLCGLDVNWSK